MYVKISSCAVILVMLCNVAYAWSISEIVNKIEDVTKESINWSSALAIDFDDEDMSSVNWENTRSIDDEKLLPVSGVTAD